MDGMTPACRGPLRASSVSLALLVACWGCSPSSSLRVPGSSSTSPETASDTVGTEGTENASGCGNELLWIWPEDGDTDVYYRAYMEAMIQEMEPAVIELYDEGKWHDAILYLIGPHLQLMPILPMKPNHTYELRLDWTCGTESLWFTTSDVGSPIGADDWAPHGWTLDLGQGVVREPLGFEDVVLDAFEGRGIALATERSAAFTQEGLSTWTVDGVQDVCVSTTPVEVSVSNPFLMWDLPDLGELEEDTLRLHDVRVSADVFEEGSGLVGGRLEGFVDTREWEVPEGYASVCDALAERYAWCRACPDDGFESCVTFRMEGIPGVATEAPLVPWTSSDVADETDCP